MKRKKERDTFELEVIGGVMGGIILLLGVAGLVNYRQASVFFSVAIGFGAALNGLLSTVRFWKKNYLLGAVFFLLALALVVLFVLQIVILKG